MKTTHIVKIRHFDIRLKLNNNLYEKIKRSLKFMKKDFRLFTWLATPGLCSCCRGGGSKLALVRLKYLIH